MKDIADVLLSPKQRFLAENGPMFHATAGYHGHAINRLFTQGPAQRVLPWAFTCSDLHS
jgi:hypothetical protein